MVKLVCLLQRPSSVSREDFHRWWTEEHIPLVRKFPGLQKYVVSLTTRALLGETDEWDGVAELWFLKDEDIEAAYSEVAGATGKADTMRHVGRILRFVTREIEVPLPGKGRS
jgi:uncharacterized protein (TIGR02118 family)